MRWLVLGLMLVAAARDADAKLVMDPPMVRKCPGAKAWDGVAACLARHGLAQVLRQVAGARLVRFVETGSRQESGLFLYVERKGAWQIGGHWPAYGDYQLLGFEPLTIGGHKGYRIDIGQIQPFAFVVDDVSPVLAVLRMRHTLFCSGDDYTCPDAVSACEVLVRGNARFAFRGVLAIEGTSVSVTGDRSKAGEQCSVQPRVYLGWSQPG